MQNMKQGTLYVGPFSLARLTTPPPTLEEANFIRTNFIGSLQIGPPESTLDAT